MKKLLACLIALGLIIISLSACSSKDEEPILVQVGPSILGAQIIADAGDKKVDLDWMAVDDAETYNIYYMASTSQPSTTQMESSGTKITGLVSAPYTVTPLANGTNYWFSISAVNPSGESNLSKPVLAIPSSPAPPAAPRNLRANAGNGQVTLTWDTVGGNRYYGYVVSNPLSLNPTFEYLNGNTEPPTEITSPFIVTPLNNNQTYAFFIWTENTNGQSFYSFVVYATPSATPPPFAPVLTGAVADSSNIVTLTWEASAGATSYNIYLGTAKGITKLTGVDGGDVGNVTTKDAGPLPTDIEGRIDIDTYYFVVTAKNANGESTESNEMSVTLTAP
jgi:hypothetical protein